MRFQYGGTKKTLDTDREGSLATLSKEDKKQAEAVNTLVDTFLKQNKQIADDARVDVSVSSSDRALSINVTIDQETVVMAQPEPAPVKNKTKKQITEKVATNAKEVVKKVERVKPEDANDASGDIAREAAKTK